MNSEIAVVTCEATAIEDKEQINFDIRDFPYFNDWKERDRVRDILTEAFTKITGRYTRVIFIDLENKIR